MMNDFIVSVEKSTRMVDLPKNVIGNDMENLQEKLIFKFTDEFVNGQGRLEYKIGSTKNYIVLSKENDTYTMPLKNVLTKEGKIEMQLVITENEVDEEIPVFKSNVFYLYCNKSINAVNEEAPDGYVLWIEQANAKLNAMDEALTEVDNLNIDVNKSGTTTTVELTKKDGTTKTVNILDGEKGENGQDGQDGLTPTIGDNGNWYLGETDTGKPSRGIQGETGQDGYTPVKGLDYFTSQDISDIETDVISVVKNANDLTYYYTKNEVDGKISSVYKYKGTVATYNDLPSNNLTVGDVYNVETDGSNYAWTGTTWDKLGGDIDLSGYQTKIDSTHKLSSDLVDDTNGTNKFTTAQEKTSWNGKLDTSKVKSSNSTTAGDVYDVTYINSMIGNIETLLGGI